MPGSAWEESQNLVMRLLEDNAKDLKEIKGTMTGEFRDIRKEIREAMDLHRKEAQGDVEEMRRQIAAQNTEIALIKQKFVLIGGIAGGGAASLIELVKLATGHH